MLKIKYMSTLSALALGLLVSPVTLATEFNPTHGFRCDHATKQSLTKNLNESDEQKVAKVVRKAESRTASDKR